MKICTLFYILKGYRKTQIDAENEKLICILFAICPCAVRSSLCTTMGPRHYQELIIVENPIDNNCILFEL